MGKRWRKYDKGGKYHESMTQAGKDEEKGGGEGKKGGDGKRIRITRSGEEREAAREIRRASFPYFSL